MTDVFAERHFVRSTGSVIERIVPGSPSVWIQSREQFVFQLSISVVDGYVAQRLTVRRTARGILADLLLMSRLGGHGMLQRHDVIVRVDGWDVP